MRTGEGALIESASRRMEQLGRGQQEKGAFGAVLRPLLGPLGCTFALSMLLFSIQVY